MRVFICNRALFQIFLESCIKVALRPCKTALSINVPADIDLEIRESSLTATRGMSWNKLTPIAIILPLIITPRVKRVGR